MSLNSIQVKTSATAPASFAYFHPATTEYAILRNTSAVSIDYTTDAGSTVSVLAAGAHKLLALDGNTADVGVRRTDQNAASVNVVIGYGFNADDIDVIVSQPTPSATAAAAAAVAGHNSDAGSHGRLTISIITYGAVGDGVTDDTAAINTAATAARVGGYALEIPQTDTGFLITGQIDLRDIRRITCGTMGFLVSSSFAGDAVLIGGGPASIYEYCDIEVSVRRQTTDWTAGNVGLKINRLAVSTLTIHNIAGFEKGLLVDATGPFSLNRVWCGQYSENKVHYWLKASAGGYITENNYYGGFFANSAQVGGADARAPIVFEASGSIVSEQKFFSPAFEIATGLIVCEALFTSAHSIQNNLFRDCRLENRGTFTATRLAKVSGSVVRGEVARISAQSITDQVQAVLDFDIPNGTDCYFSVELASRFPSPRTGLSLITAMPFVFKGNGECGILGATGWEYNPGRVVPAEDNVASVAFGDGQYMTGYGTLGAGVFVYKGTSVPMVLTPAGGCNGEFCVQCWDSSGNLLTGTSTYYVKGRSHSYESSRNAYVAYPEFIWIHKDVAKFFIAPTQRNSPWVVAQWAFDIGVGTLLGVGGATPTCALSTAPTKSYHNKGTFFGSSASNTAFRCTSRVDSALTSVAAAGATSVVMSSTNGMLANDIIGIELDDIVTYSDHYRNMHWTTIQSVTNGTTLVLAAAIPVGKNASIGRRVYTNRWITVA